MALNEGLIYCSNELVARMDTDDIAKPQRFQKQINVFIQNPDIDVCGAWTEEFEGNINNVKMIRKEPECNEDLYLYARFRTPVGHPVVMFRKEAVLSVGGYKHFLFL